MFSRTASPEDLVRLKRECEDADRAYNDALTLLDAAIQQFPKIPQPPTVDDSDLVDLGERASLQLSDSAPDESRWRARLRRLVVTIVRPSLERQESFNSAIVEHMTRNVAARREEQHVLEQTTVVLQEQFAALISFQSRLIQYAQQITPYLDTKVREVADGRCAGLASGLDLLTRTYRVLKESVGVLQSSTIAVKRELQRLDEAPPGSPVEVTGAHTVGGSGGSRHLDAYKYVGFEDAFRGDREEIGTRQRTYVDSFQGASDVLDVGCGRGEFLELLREQQISARGIDANGEMIEQCRERGLEATQADALSYLEALPDESLGGLFAAQVVEHLPASYLMRLLEVAHQKLRPQSTILLETINPACWMAFFSAYIRDITHRHPIHPETLRYLLHASGFVSVEVVYSSPQPEESKLQSVTIDATLTATPESDSLTTLTETFNRNVDRLNGLIFAEHDYAAVAKRY